MAGHTKGGWTAYGFEVYADEDCETHTVADCTPNSSCRLEDEAVANARLIAAAPEMLEALEEFSREYDGFQDGNGDYCSTLEKARAAIAKAVQP